MVLHTYEEVQKIREEVINEMQRVYPNLTLEHYKLAEMRVQTILMADSFKGKAVDKIKINKKHG
jgi:hypothetical protein